MDGALVGAGSLWPPHPSPHGAKLLDSKQKSFFFVLYTWKGAASPYFSVFTLSKIIIVIVSSSSIPVLIQCQLLGLTIRLVWLRVSAEANRWVLFFLFFFFG